MSESGRKLDKNYEYKQIAKERSIWLLRPVMAVCVVVWAFHPTTALTENLREHILLGFLLGALFGIVLNLGIYRYYLFTRRLNTTNRHNRVPDEYYFGHVKKVLYDQNSQ